jgi:hypothetical protein
MSAVAEARPQAEPIVVKAPEQATALPTQPDQQATGQESVLETTVTVSAITASSPSQGDLPCVGCNAGSCATCPYGEQIKVKWESLSGLPDPLDSLNNKSQKPMLTLRRIDTPPTEITKPKTVIPLMPTAEPMNPSPNIGISSNTQFPNAESPTTASNAVEEFVPEPEPTPIPQAWEIPSAPKQQVGEAKVLSPLLTPDRTQKSDKQLPHATTRKELVPSPTERTQQQKVVDSHFPTVVIQDMPADTLQDEKPAEAKPTFPQVEPKQEQATYESTYKIPVDSGINEEPKLPTPMTKIAQAENPEPQKTNTTSDAKTVPVAGVVSSKHETPPTHIKREPIPLKATQLQNEALHEQPTENIDHPLQAPLKNALPQAMAPIEISESSSREQENFLEATQTESIAPNLIMPVAKTPVEDRIHKIIQPEVYTSESANENEVTLPGNISEEPVPTSDTDINQEVTFETYDVSLPISDPVADTEIQATHIEHVPTEAVAAMKEILIQEERIHDELAPTKILKINNRILVAKVQEALGVEQTDQEAVDDSSELKTTKELVLVLSVAVEEDQEGQELQNEKNAVIIKVTDQVAENLHLVRTILSDETPAPNHTDAIDEPTKEPIILVAKNNFIVMPRAEAAQILKVYENASDEIRSEKVSPIEIHNSELPLRKITDAFSFEMDHQHLDTNEEAPEYVAIPLETPRPTAEIKALTKVTEVITTMEAIVGMSKEANDQPYNDTELEIPVSDDLLAVIDAIYAKVILDKSHLYQENYEGIYIFTSEHRELRVNLSELDTLLERILMEQQAVDSILIDLGLLAKRDGNRRNKNRYHKEHTSLLPAMTLSIWQTLLQKAV